jgi:hypothetical protein
VVTDSHTATESGGQLADTLTADNARELLAQVTCPCCGSVGTFELFHEPNNNGTGIVCRSCGTRHPPRPQRVMWLRHDEKKQPKRSNDIAAVIHECGAYCYVCGTDFRILRRRGIGRHVHHTRPFAEHGEEFRKIPMCALCHEIASAMQRQMRKLLAAGATNDALIERVQQELTRRLGSWFTGTASRERAFERIMQCVRSAVTQPMGMSNEDE